VDLSVIDVPRCPSSNAKTLGWKHLQLPNVASSSKPRDGAGIVHHGTDELPIEQNTIPEGEATLLVHERTQHAQFLGSFLPNVVDVRRPC
jgi:hypothetical protein